jgi:hypothetical protein
MPGVTIAAAMLGAGDLTAIANVGAGQTMEIFYRMAL